MLIWPSRPGTMFALSIALSAAVPAPDGVAQAPEQLPAPVVVAPVDSLPPSVMELAAPLDPAADAWQREVPLVAGMGIWSAGAPHLVLRPHGPAPTHGKVPWTHLDRHREDVTGPPAALPGATTVHLQKTPYSYGYFGATPRRHWSLHYGHQQNYTQWRQR